MQSDFAMLIDLATALFWSKKLVSLLLLPPLAPLLLTAAGLLMLRRHPRGGLALAWLGVLTSFALASSPPVGWLAQRLEAPAPVALGERTGAQAIVILGGGKRRHAPEFGGETINRLTLERVRYGARLARETGLPVLVSGGAPSGDSAEADLMKAALEQEFRIPVRWAERASRDTRENALFSAVQLKAAGIERVLLVTHAIHMARAEAEFAAQGLEVIPAPTAWLSGPDPAELDLSVLPNAGTAYAAWLTLHEALGRLAQRLGR